LFPTVFKIYSLLLLVWCLVVSWIRNPSTTMERHKWRHA